MKIFTLYTKENCKFCVLLKKKLNDYGMAYKEVNLEENADAMMFLRKQGHRSVPQLYLDGVHVNKVDTAKISKEYLEQYL